MLTGLQKAKQLEEEKRQKLEAAERAKKLARGRKREVKPELWVQTKPSLLHRLRQKKKNQKNWELHSQKRD